MITVYLADTALISSEKAWKRYEAMLDGERLDKLRRCRNMEDGKRSLLAGCLIQAGVRERLYGEGGPQADAAPLSLAYAFGAEGKPYLKDYPDIFFSLSHSGNYVLCALSDRETGADIQEYRGRKDGIARRFFSEKDREWIEEGIRQGFSWEEMFYRIWTVKEAYMKLTGQGMRQEMDAIRLKFRDRETGSVGENAHFTLCREVERYEIAVCSYTEMTDIVIKRMRE